MQPSVLVVEQLGHGEQELLKWRKKRGKHGE